MFKRITAHLVLCVLFLSACAAHTLYNDVPVSQLSDDQLVEEIASAAEGLGITMNRSAYLLAIRPEPAYVLTSSTTTFSANVGATYNAYSMPLGYGVATTGNIRANVSGTGTTQYHYTDVNATARLGSAIAMAITQRREAAYRRRGQEVFAEYQRRVTSRRMETERLITEFFSSNPELQSRRMLVAAVAPWAAAQGAASPAEILEKTRTIISNMSAGPGLTGHWFGMFSQTTKLANGEVSTFSQFVKLALAEQSGRVIGKGMLGSGEVIELDGNISGKQLTAAVANTTSAINVTLSAVAMSNQLTGEFSGSGAGQRMTGTFVLLR